MRGTDHRLVTRFQRRLLAWYGKHGRDLPWRRTRHPYRILVSEIMLQQTQVDRVIPKYREFLRRYPTLRRLAAADVSEVRQVWYPLGYNARPVRLHAIARETLARYGGRLPDDRGALRRLPGIGRYTASAMLSFAFGRDAALIDTNVRRVLGRVFLGPRRAKRMRGENAWWQLAETLVPAGRAYDFNQALMDFGATWCTPRRPRCPSCPMKPICATYPALAPASRPSRRARERTGWPRSATALPGASAHPTGASAHPTGASAHPPGALRARGAWGGIDSPPMI